MAFHNPELIQLRSYLEESLESLDYRYAQLEYIKEETLRAIHRLYSREKQTLDIQKKDINKKLQLICDFETQPQGNASIFLDRIKADRFDPIISLQEPKSDIEGSLLDELLDELTRAKDKILEIKLESELELEENNPELFKGLNYLDNANNDLPHMEKEPRVPDIHNAKLGDLKEVAVINQHTGMVYTICVSTDYIVSGSWDNTVNLFSLSDFRLVQTFKDHTDPVRSVAISKKNQYIASGSWDKTIKLYRLREERYEHTFTVHDMVVTSLVFTNNEKNLISALWDSFIILWDLDRKTMLKKIQLESTGVNCLAISSDDEYLISGSDGNVVILWYINQSNHLELTRHKESVISIAISKDNKYIASVSLDNTLKLWNIKENKEEYAMIEYTNGITSVCFSHDSEYMVTGCRDNLIRIWNLQDKACVRISKGSTEHINTIAVSDDSQYIISGSGYNRYGISTFQTTQEFSIRVWEFYKANIKLF